MKPQLWVMMEVPMMGKLLRSGGHGTGGWTDEEGREERDTIGRDGVM